MSAFNRALIYYVNCTDSSSTCESLSSLELAIGGVNGVCNAATGACECPSTHFGSDLLGLWNDCHVPKAQINSVFVALVVVSAIAVAIVLVALLRSFHMWKLVRIGTTNSLRTMESTPDQPPPAAPTTMRIVALPDVPLALADTEPYPDGKDSPDSTKVSRKSIKTEAGRSEPSRRSSLMISVNLSSLQSPKINAPSKALAMQTSLVRRRRIALVVFVCQLVFACSSLAYAIITLDTMTRFEQTWWLQLLLLTLSISFIVIGLCAVVYAWYSNLPNIIVFAAMIPSIRHTLIVAYPMFVKRILTAIVVAVSTFSFVLLFVIPMADPWLIDAALVHAGLCLLGIVVAVLVSTLLYVCSILLRLFAEVNSLGRRESSRHVAGSPAPAVAHRSESVTSPPLGSPAIGSSEAKRKTSFTATGAAKRELAQSVRMVRMVVALAVLGEASVVALCFAMAFWEFAKRNYYIFVAALQMGGCLVLAVVCFILVMWTD